jgi:hypothetical protein
MRLLLAIIIATGASGCAGPAGCGFARTADLHRFGNPWLCSLHGAAGRVRADPTGEDQCRRLPPLDFAGPFVAVKR